MQARNIKLSDKWVHFLVNLPETGMGYQLVKIFLKSGKILRKHKVLNSSFLLLEKGESINVNEIVKIEPDN